MKDLREILWMSKLSCTNVELREIFLFKFFSSSFESNLGRISFSNHNLEKKKSIRLKCISKFETDLGQISRNLGKMYNLFEIRFKFCTDLGHNLFDDNYILNPSEIYPKLS